ncbi:hypothetical protein WJX72_008943 [[Myrmecia] bisecta]|uniref:Uncharacterized protein n=1 Tax=[Myrmecia] bisecta TaxID=41462 RepID=A0AAW1R8L4_9CHLO
MKTSEAANQAHEFLVTQQESLSALLQHLHGVISQVPSLDEAALQDLLRLEGNRVINLLTGQLIGWNALLKRLAPSAHVKATGATAATSTMEDAACTPAADSRHQSIQSKLAAMGGKPALGSMILPTPSPSHLKGLAARAAAQEVLQAKAAEQEPGSPSPQRELKPPGAGSNEKSPIADGLPPAESELAAALQRRRNSALPIT